MLQTLCLLSICGTLLIPAQATLVPPMSPEDPAASTSPFAGTEAPDTTTLPDADLCGLALVLPHLGTAWTEIEALALPFPGTLRVVGPNQPMTMDFRADRLTATLDDDGILIDASCV